MPARRYDAILLDLDGTLVTDEGAIRPRTLASIREAHARGVRVMLATGRSEAATRGVLNELGFDTPAVVFNGAAVWCPVEERLVVERVLADQAVERALEWIHEAQVLPVVVRAGEKYTLEARTEHEAMALRYFHDLHVVERDQIPADRVIRITAFSTAHPDSEAFAEEIESAIERPVYVTHFPLSSLAEHRSSPLSVVDVHPPCRGKAEGLHLLQERYGIAPERVVAVGDAHNDIPMFEAAGLGVAMENAMPEAQAAADRVIGDNNSDSLAELFEELFPAE